MPECSSDLFKKNRPLTGWLKLVTVADRPVEIANFRLCVLGFPLVWRD
jgi:hypothetical protein